jgi:hypothetical protein
MEVGKDFEEVPRRLEKRLGCAKELGKEQTVFG